MKLGLLVTLLLELSLWGKTAEDGGKQPKRSAKVGLVNVKVEEVVSVKKT